MHTKTFGVINVLMLLGHATARALAAQVTQEHLDDGLVYPPFQSIRKISANIAAAVADKAYELGIYTHVFTYQFYRRLNIYW